MRVFVTGGAGFIGSHYVRTMLSDGYSGFEGSQVTVLDKLTYAGNLANLAPVTDSPRYRFIRGDIADAQLLAKVLPGHDTVVNFAAETHVDRSIAGARDFVHTNVVGAQALFQAALNAGVDKVVHIGTDEVYGSIETGSWTEDHALLPNSPYSASKASAELLARSYHRTHGLNICTTRCSNNYGPYQFPEKVIPLFITNLLEGRKVPLYGAGQNSRDWLHVDDHCRGVQLVLERGKAGESYNIGGGEELTNVELTRRLLHLVGHETDMIEYVEDRKGHDLRYSVDFSKLASLGYQPCFDFNEGLAETVSWYWKNQEWWEPLKRRQKMRLGRVSHSSALG